MPWNKGYMGIDWAYLESAYFDQGFTPWLTRDHTIELKRSHTEPRIRFYHISKAINAVETINNMIRQNNNTQRSMTENYIEQG